MKRSTEFDNTVRFGIRAVQPDLVIHAHRGVDETGPRVGVVVTKAVGSAVERHRVARRLRHVARRLLTDMDRRELVVIRALASSRCATSTRLEEQLKAGLRRIHERTRTGR